MQAPERSAVSTFSPGQAMSGASNSTEQKQ